MGDYIARESVINMLEDAQIISDGEYCGYCTEDVSIMSIPSADVRPVVHGTLMESETNAFFGHYKDGEPIFRDVKTYWCNKCGRGTIVKENFCPRCGACMMEE